MPDLSLIDANGTTVASKAKFLSADIKSRTKLLETYLTLDATLTGFAPGDYKLQYALRDLAGNKQTTFEVPITLTPAMHRRQMPRSSEAAFARCVIVIRGSVAGGAGRQTALYAPHARN